MLAYIMQAQDAAIYAAIDIGSNTLREVVARSTPDGLEILADDEELVRIGESVNATGAISSEKQELALSVLHRFQELAKQHNAQRIVAVATEAIRKAKNRDEFLGAIQRETGIVVECIGSDVESVLTFYGATSELQDKSAWDESIGVLDLGGGSMELVIAQGQQIHWHTSLPIGSGWLHDRYLFTNPPSTVDVAAARAFLTTYFQGLNVEQFPAVLRATGGSANTLLKLAHRAFGLPEIQSSLSYDDLCRCEQLLCELPAEEIAQRYGIDAKRARILSAGALIIRALVERFHLDELQISTQGIREGLILAYARFGEHWLHYVQLSARSSEREADEKAGEETFAQAGRRLLLERLRKMVQWRDEVLKNEDVEAVHKMRVASRRLRAVLDAYEAVCAPRPYKKVYRRVRKTADILGQARDTDVMIQHLQERLQQAAPEEQLGLRWLAQRLSAYRQSYQKKLAAHMREFDADELEQLIAQCVSGER
jgi:exopolyphosphatase/pppGpp-phosphohydrolase